MTRADIEALAAKLRRPVTRACPKTPGVDAEAVLARVVERVLAAREGRSARDPIVGAEQWRIAWRTTVEAIEDLLATPANHAAIPEPDRLWAAARRELRPAELARLDRRATRDLALRERLTVARVFAEHAALDEEETLDAGRIAVASGELPEELEDLAAPSDRRGLLRLAAFVLLAVVAVALAMLAWRWDRRRAGLPASRCERRRPS